MLLSRFQDGKHALYDCSRCGGQFAPHVLVLELARRRTRLNTPEEVPRSAVLDEVVYRECPVCRTLMSRKNFGGNSGVVVDVCTTHGVWFDRGELPKVLAYIEADGLVALRRDALGVEKKALNADVARQVARMLKEQRAQPTTAPNTKDVVFGVLEGSLDVLNLAGRWLIGNF